MPRKRLRGISADGWKDFAQFTHTDWRTRLESEHPRFTTHVLAFRVWEARVDEAETEIIRFNAIVKFGAAVLVDRVYRYTRTVADPKLRGPLEQHARIEIES